MTEGFPPAITLRVAVIDTDSGFVAVLAKRLERVGWQTLVAPPGATPDDLTSLRAGALVVDLGVVGLSPWDELARIRAALPWLPIVVCTAQASVADRVRGLRLGADDWMAKPCHPEEVIARLEAIVRRQRQSEVTLAPASVQAGELDVRSDQFQAFAAGRSADLTRREFELLALLAAADGRVLEREEIYRRVWGYAMARGDRSVDVFVRKVRQKLRRVSPGWNYIHTHFGVGYRFAAEEDDGLGAEEAAEAGRPGDPEQQAAPPAPPAGEAGPGSSSGGSGVLARVSR
jgi:DNA-binding response OmpR family regulator